MRNRMYGTIVALLGCSLGLAGCGSKNTETANASPTGANATGTANQDWTQLVQLVDCSSLGQIRDRTRDNPRFRGRLGELGGTDLHLPQRQGQIPFRKQHGSKQAGDIASLSPGGAEDSNVPANSSADIRGSSEVSFPDNSRIQPLSCESGRLLFTLNRDGTYMISDGSSGQLSADELNQIQSAIGNLAPTDGSSRLDCEASRMREGDHAIFLTLGGNRQVTLASSDSRMSCSFGAREQVRSLRMALLPLISKYLTQDRSGSNNGDTGSNDGDNSGNNAGNQPGNNAGDNSGGNNAGGNNNGGNNNGGNDNSGGSNNNGGGNNNS